MWIGGDGPGTVNSGRSRTWKSLRSPLATPKVNGSACSCSTVTGPGGRTDAFDFSQQVGQVGGAGDGDVGAAGAFCPCSPHAGQQLCRVVFGFAAVALAHKSGQHHAGGSA